MMKRLDEDLFVYVNYGSILITLILNLHANATFAAYLMLICSKQPRTSEGTARFSCCRCGIQKGLFIL